MRPISVIKSKLSRYRGEKKGVAALEFTLFLPLLLTMMIGGLELVTFTWTTGRVQDAASSVSDLTSQNVSVDEQRMRGIFSAAHRMIDPVKEGGTDLSSLEVTVSSVIGCPCDGDVANANENSDYCYTVLWSHRLKGSLPGGGAGVPNGRPQGSAVGFIPSELVRAPNETLIVTETEFRYEPDFQFVLQDAWFDLEERSYFRPRLADRVIHTGNQSFDQEPTCTSLPN